MRRGRRCRCRRRRPGAGRAALSGWDCSSRTKQELDPGPAHLRPARAGGRGCAEPAHAAEDRELRPGRAAGHPAHGALRRRRRGSRVRRDQRVPLADLRDRGAAGGGERAARGQAAAGAAAGAAGGGQLIRALGDHGSGGGRVRSGRRRARARHRPDRGHRVLRRGRADRADLLAAQRGHRLLPSRPPAARGDGHRRARRPQEAAALLPRRPGPPAPGRRGDHRPA